MSDGRKNNGGSRKGAGRKPKAEEEKLIELLDKQINKEEAITTLKKLIKQGDFKALQLYYNYRFGKPKETKDIKLDLESNFPDWLDES